MNKRAKTALSARPIPPCLMRTRLRRQKAAMGGKRKRRTSQAGGTRCQAPAPNATPLTRFE